MSDGIGYSSEYYDEDVGIVFYPFRAYDPENGRWLQRDPAEEGISPHLYVYAKNDPVGHADYLGLAKYDCRRANSTFSFSKEFSGASGVLPSISISIQRTIEEERCTIDCDKCKKGYSIERTITDSSGAGFTLKEIGPVVILGVPMYFSLDVGANVYGNKFYYYDSCTDKSTESGEACVSVSATVSGGPCVKVGPFIKICAKAALTAKWDSCSDQRWSADIISGKLW